MRKSAFCLLLLSTLGSQVSAAASSNILVDQLGWLTGSTKVAVLAAPQVGTGSPSAFIQVRTKPVSRSCPAWGMTTLVAIPYSSALTMKPASTSRVAEVM